jgi:hypothetical protein
VITDCDRLAAMAPALAIGALDPADAAFARRHLAECTRRHPELSDALGVAAAIGAAIPEPDLPSADLRARVLAAARAERASRAVDVAPAAAADPGPWRWVAAGVGGLALAASLALAVQVGENRALDERLAAADGRLAALETQVDTAEAWIERAVAQGADAYFMDGEGEAQQASFMLVVEEEASGAVLLMSNLPELAAGETYELWVERDGDIVGVGTFLPDDRGLAAMMIDASLTGIRQAMITVEPDGGAAAPNVDAVIMEGELSL